MNKVIVFGATSGIAQALQRIMAAQGKSLLLVGRSQARLAEVAADLKARGAAQALTCEADLAEVAQHKRVLEFAQQNLAGFDTVVVAYGTLLDQGGAPLTPQRVQQELHTNFVSVAALLTALTPHFEARRGGTIAVLTSVAGDRGRRSNYVYGSAKGGLGLFLQGLRSQLFPAGVRVLTIKPGPVNTPMTAHMKKGAIFSEPDAVAQQIYRALENGSADVVYTPARWKWIMLAIRAIPERWFKKLSL